ncbi:MAG: plasmid pRiA4b ORF-3 family protein [Leptolyngbya sp. DLM2.Bin15]|nr:MAG: plasmid pRiA4b ORF-3 family protein [Leptolyngbya sp. DLM2.Bin15]
MVETFNSIVELTDEFAHEHLNEEYAQLIRQATAALCRKRPSPLAKGQTKSWAGGITHALGMVNFLFDPSQTPHVTSAQLYQWFGISSSTGQSKSKLVRDKLDMHQIDPDWCLPSRMEDNPLIWILSVNGILMDVRSAPLVVQIDAFRQGLIPYIPKAKDQSEAIAAQLDRLSSATKKSTSKSRKKQQSSKKPSPHPPASSEALQSVYVLEVMLIDGPLTDKFIQKNPHVLRTIEIQGHQTLADFHQIIFKAFNREEEHMYEFQLKGQGPRDPNAERYGLEFALNDDFAPLNGDVAKTQIGSLGLELEEMFGYWFDFGDSWWHRIQVLAIQDPKPRVKYPRITNRIGTSPPQYADFD